MQFNICEYVVSIAISKVSNADRNTKRLRMLSDGRRSSGRPQSSVL